MPERYNSPVNCETLLKSDFISNTSRKIRASHDIDMDSRLGTYLQVNPDLETPTYENNTFEIERTHITRFRTFMTHLFSLFDAHSAYIDALSVKLNKHSISCSIRAVRLYDRWYRLSCK